MKKFPFLICPNALPVADYRQFIGAVSKTQIKNIGVRATWIPFDGIDGTSLCICDIGVCGNFAEKAVQQKLLDIMDTAEVFHIPLVNTACPPDISTAAQRNAAAFFHDAADCAKEKNLQYTMETYGPISRTAEECLRLLELVDHETLQICYDTANVWRFAPEFKTTDDLTNDFRKLKGHIGYMHLKDFDPVSRQIMVPGKGAVDFPAIFTQLDEWGFDGFVGLDLETTRASKLNTLAAHEEELHISLEYFTSLGVIG